MHRTLGGLSLLFCLSGSFCLDAAPLSAAEPPYGRALLERLDQIVEESRARYHIPGIAIAVERGDQLVLARGYGWADVENQVPVTEHTVFRIGSVSKQYTAAAVMRLVEQGKVKLDDPFDRYLQDVKTGGFRITVAQLLDHTSGYKGYTEMPDFWTKSRLDLSHQDMVAMFTSVPFEFEPGDQWRYNNSAYYLAGLLIEKVSGNTFAGFLGSEFFDPLGLRESHYLYEAPIVPNRAAGYALNEGELRNDEPLSMHLPYAAGALGASVLDLLRWQRALVSGRVVSAASYSRMTTPVALRDGSTFPYGLGLFLTTLDGHRKIHHAGGINGFLSQLAHYPDDQLHVAVLANCGCAHPTALENRIARLMLGLAEPTVAPVALSDAELERYAGTYDPGRAPVTFVVKDGALTIFGSKLVPTGDHRFVNADDPDDSYLFTVEGGRAVSLRQDREGLVQTGARVADPP